MPTRPLPLVALCARAGVSLCGCFPPGAGESVLAIRLCFLGANRSWARGHKRRRGISAVVEEAETVTENENETSTESATATQSSR